MSAIAILLTGLLVLGGGILVILGLLWIAFGSNPPDRSGNGTRIDPKPPTDGKGDGDRLPKHLLDQISKIIEENIGVRIPTPESIDKILAEMPAKDREKLLPILIPLVVDTIREATNMNLEASLRLKEFLLGQGLGQTQLDGLIESDAMRTEKVLSAVKRYEEIMAPYKELLQEKKALLEFMEKLLLYRLITEAFKDMPLPPEWLSKQVSGLLSLPSAKENHQDGQKVVRGEVIERRERGDD